MLFKKLLTSYIFIIIIPLFTIGIIVTNITTKIINEQVDIATEQALSQASGNIMNIIDNAKNTALSISMNKELQYIFSNRIAQSNIEIDKEVVTIRNDILYPGIFNHNYSSVEIYAILKDKYPKIKRRNDVMSAAIIKNTIWYKETLKLKGKFYFHISNDFDAPEITLSKVITNLKDFKVPIAIISINIDLEEINKILEDIHLGKTGKAYLVDRLGKLITPVDGKFAINNELMLSINSDNQIISIKGKKFLIKYMDLPKTEWRIIEMVPYSELTEKADLIKNVIYIIGLLSLIISILISLYFSFSISRPIIKLAKTMENMEAGDFNIQVKTISKGEVAILYSRFNYMISMINELISKVYISQIKEKDSELKALQAQINPHFLYNTLNSINWLSIKYKVPEISKLVTSLASILRYSLNKGQKLIDIENELRQVESYITIEKTVLPNKFDVEFDIEPEILKYQTIKLILQPLVENAIIHGIETYDGKGSIRIRGYIREDKIIFAVANNGNPIDLSKIDIILDDSDEAVNESLGIRNVNNRLKLSYGDEYGLKFVSKEGWTIAEIAIPIEKPMV